MRIIQFWALAVSALFLWPATEKPVRASEQEPFRVHVADYPRPISEAVRQIEKHFGRVVTYDDTRYVHPDDIVDITAKVRRDGDLSKRVFVMRNGSIDVTYSAAPGTSVDKQVEEVSRRSSRMPGPRATPETFASSGPQAGTTWCQWR
jgi:hypothetical protein